MAQMNVYCFLLLLLKCSVASEDNYHNIIQNSYQTLKGYSRHVNQTALLQDINAMNKALNVRTILDNLQTFSDELDKFSELSDSVIIGNTTNVNGFNVTSTLNQNTDINSLPTTAYATPEQSDTTLAKDTATVHVTTESMVTTVLPVTVTPSYSPVITSTAPPLPKVNALCLNHTQSILGGLFGGKQWAMQMLDALGKPPAGLLGGKFAWLGDYDECIGITADEFHGEYCLAKFYVASISNPLTKAKGMEIRVGMCLPNTCSISDIKNLFNSVLPRISNNTVFATGGDCKKPDQPIDFRARIAFIIIGVLVGLAIIATTYDIIIQHMSKPKKNSWDLFDGHATTYDSAGNGHVNNGYEGEKNGPISDLSGQKHKYQFKEPDRSMSVEDPSTTQYKPHEPGFLGKLLLSFSVYTNGAKILSTNQGSGTLTAVNGIRFISMSWVILGHTYAFGLYSVGNIGTLYGALIKRKTFMAIINAEVSVDTFFALSGTLLTYVVLNQLKKQKGRLNWFMFYFHRFWRLTPPYMLIMMVQICISKYLGSGPMWSTDGFEKKYCKDTWWWNLLYINNFKTSAEECFAHAWYLANDMQFYVISPPILLALYHSKIAGTIVTLVLWVGTAISTAVISVQKDLRVNPFSGGDYFDAYYQMPYCRIGPYLVGMYTGYILYTTKCKCKINKFVNITIWAVFAASALAVLYGVYDDINGDQLSTGVAALYNVLHKTVWGAAVCWVIFACATGNGGFVNTILSWRGFVPLSRLTYCAYLIHPLVMYFYYQSRKQFLFWDDHEVIYEFFAHLGMAYAVAFVASLVFESPMMGLEKVVFRKDKKK
ncbi:O-acyltransferase like protein-like isoform X5 [Mytilus californianus]|uniref:O-acyltransferase like protein-like isoform X2 n=1 Tax=Mytilus californianus TaxID=6549 RepID=UPI002245C9E6|nr:O-acyltransferase like protein-like isoform X2 [Mytilus californianus]XP_052094568.1 O-acyltransferase like protein-like isoform X3 [Mytilus californianus]XP_052094569.1 O-acyltransferase like protein-like isoform X4 [Mytilus californianus]XP_052094570.1 O-acyltransferase like protein-like isoform X5 [Mytilus californianus]